MPRQPDTTFVSDIIKLQTKEIYSEVSNKIKFVTKVVSG